MCFHLNLSLYISMYLYISIYIYLSLYIIGAEHATYQKKPGDMAVLMLAVTGLVSGVGMAVVGLGRITLGWK